MASTHSYPNDTVFWRIRGVDEIELIQVNDSVTDFDTVYAVLDETLVNGIIVDYLVVPKKLDIGDADIGSQESQISSRLDAAMLDYMRSRAEQDPKEKQRLYNNWRYQLAKKSGGKLKPSKPRRVMPDQVISVR